MKLKNYVEKMGKNGEIIIPRDYWGRLGFCPGEEVTLKLAEDYVRVEPVKEAVVSKKKKNGHPRAARTPHLLKQLSGILEINDLDVEELIAKEDWYD